MAIELKTIRPGDGKNFPEKGKLVTIHYIGTFETGHRFDSSRDRGKPLKFRLGRKEIIEAWDEGIPRMSLGERAKLICPSDLAFGVKGHPGLIPANSKLIFDIELLDIE